MKAFFLICSFCLLTVAVFAQNAKIDSLKKIIATTKVDTVKGRSLCKLCLEYFAIGQTEEAFATGEKGLEIATKNKHLEGIAYCNNKIGYLYLSTGNFKSAMPYLQGAVENYQKVGNQREVGRVLMNLAGCYESLGNIQQGLKTVQSSLKIALETKDTMSIARCQLTIGYMYYGLGNLPYALDHFLLCLPNLKKINDVTAYVACLKNISATYVRLNDLKKASQYLHECVAFAEKNGSVMDKEQAYLGLGNFYSDTRNYGMALKYFEKVLLIAKNRNENSIIASCLNNIGLIYQAQKRYVEAIDKFRQALTINKQLGIIVDVSANLINLSNSYVNLNKYDIAKNYALEGIDLARQINHIEWMKNASVVLFIADSALGNWKSAFEYHKLFKQYSDSLHNEEKAKEFGRVESKYQFEKEAEEQKRKEAEAKRIAQEATERRNNLQYLSIFGGLLVLFGGLAFVGKLKIPARVLDITLFAALLILFEFLLILFDPLLDQYTGGVPVQKLVFNSVIALGFAPLHSFLEKKLRKRMTTTTKS
jgi:tetratricopeptide (TPR) repeat protein